MQIKNPPGKFLSIITYITFIGLIIAYFMNRDAKHEFARKHIKNMFGLLIILLVAQVSHAYVAVLLGDILWLCAFVLWTISITTAFMGISPAIPLLSKKFQEWFLFLD